MKVSCFKCRKKFTPRTENTLIIGPDVEITCPFCYYKYRGKMTSFVRDQVGGFNTLSAHDATTMIEMAQFIELNSSDYYKKRGLRHGKKKVRNVRN